MIWLKVAFQLFLLTDNKNLIMVYIEEGVDHYLAVAPTHP